MSLTKIQQLIIRVCLQHISSDKLVVLCTEFGVDISGSDLDRQTRILDLLFGSPVEDEYVDDEGDDCPVFVTKRKSLFSITKNKKLDEVPARKIRLKFD